MQKDKTEEKVKTGGLKKEDNKSEALAHDKAIEASDGSEKNLNYFKDQRDNLEDRRTGETYDKDRLEGLYHHAEKDDNDVNPIDVRDNERPQSDEHVTYTKAEEEDGDDHNVVRPGNDRKLQADDKTIEKDAVNKDNSDLEAENQAARNKAGESYNSEKNK
jgi:hypothetical protein